jgi:hypothetical protein
VVYVANVAEADLAAGGGEGGGGGEGAGESAAARIEAKLAAELAAGLAGRAAAAGGASAGSGGPGAPAGGTGAASVTAGGARAARPPEVVAVSAKIEAELAELAPEERREFMAGLGLARSGLERLVERSFDLLDLVRFYTVAHRKLRAWEVERGTPAPRAAGKIHSDMERGFIRAQVAAFADLAAHGSFAELARHGLVRTEGKGYEIADGDVVEFLFHV